MNPFNDILGIGKEIGVGLVDAKTYCTPRVKKTNKVRVIAPDNPEDKYNLLTPQRVADHLERYKDEIILQYDRPQPSDNVFKNEKISSCKITAADMKFIAEDTRKWCAATMPTGSGSGSGTSISNSNPCNIDKAPAGKAHFTTEMQTAEYSLDQIPIKVAADLACAESGPAKAAFRSTNFTNRQNSHAYNISCQTMPSHCYKIQNKEIIEKFEHDVKNNEYDSLSRKSIVNNKTDRYKPNLRTHRNTRRGKLASAIANRQLNKERKEFTPEQRTIENFEHTHTNHDQANIRQKSQITPEQRTIENFEHKKSTGAPILERFHIDETDRLNVVDGINREDYAHIYQDGNARPY